MRLFIATLLMLLGFAPMVLATSGGHEEVCFCHNVEHNPHTICTDKEGLINGHMAHVESGFDALNECPPEIEETPLPTESPVASESPSVEPSESPDVVVPSDAPKTDDDDGYNPYLEGSGCSLRVRK